MTRPRTWPVHLAAGLVLIAGLVSLIGFDPFKEGVWGAMATHLMQADSIARDFDRRYTSDDAIRWAQEGPVETGPRGLFLKHATRNRFDRRRYYYGMPVGYALWSAPLVRLIGWRGPLAINAVLLAVLVWMLGLWWSRRGSAWAAAVFALAVVGLSLAPAYVYVMEPDLYRPVLLGSGLMLILVGLERADVAARVGFRAWWRLALGGLLLGAAVYEKPAFLFFAVALAVYVLRRRWSGRLIALAAAVVAWTALTAVHLVQERSLSPYTGDRRHYVQGAYPWAEREAFQAGRPGEEALPDGGTPRPAAIIGAAGLAGTLRMAAVNLPRNLLYFLAGRQTGLIAYAPGLLVCLLLWLTCRERRRTAWIGAGVFAYLLFYFVFRSTNYFGSGTSLGNRNVLHVLPAAALLAPRLPRGRWFALVLAPIVILGGLLLLPPLIWRHPGRDLRPDPDSLRFAVLGHLNRMKRPGLVWLPVDLTQAPHLFAWPREVIELPDGGRLYRLAGTRPSPGLGTAIAPDETVRFVVSTPKPVDAVTVRLFAGPGGAEIRPADGSAPITLPPGACRNVDLPVPEQARVATDEGDRWLCALTFDVAETERSGSSIALGIKPASPPAAFALPDGAIDLGGPNAAQHLLWGWTGPLQDAGGTRFRAADELDSYLLVHLPPGQGDYVIEADCRAYSPPCRAGVFVGDAPAVGRADLSTAWTTVRGVIPASLLDTGVTTIRFSHSNLVTTRPTADADRERPLAAAYRRITVRPARKRPAPAED